MEHPSIQQLNTPGGEFCKPPSFANSVLSSSYELSPGYIAIVREHSFLGRDKQNPYHHPHEFEQVCSCLKILGMTRETLKWKLFPFSLKESARQWYDCVVRSMNREWSKLQDWFCLAFFLLSLVCALRVEILTFRQAKKESIGATWARLSLLAQSSPDLSLSDHLLLQHFYAGPS
jgi:hypothetical protein